MIHFGQAPFFFFINIDKKKEIPCLLLQLYPLLSPTLAKFLFAMLVPLFTRDTVKVLCKLGAMTSCNHCWKYMTKQWRAKTLHCSSQLKHLCFETELVNECACDCCFEFYTKGLLPQALHTNNVFKTNLHIHMHVSICMIIDKTQNAFTKPKWN